MIYYCDCDGHGLDSVRNIIRDNPNEINVIDGGTFKAFNDNATKTQFKAGDTFIVDTLSELSANLIREYRFRNMKEGESFESYYNSWDRTGSQSAYAMAEQIFMQSIKMLHHKGVKIILTMHEGTQINEKTGEKTTGPELSPKFFNRISGSCNTMFRLKVEYTQKQQGNGKVIPVEKRILMIRPVEEYILKCHAPPEEIEKIPFELVNPTLPKLINKLGFEPSFMVIYGAPGSGKSSFALSQFAKTKENNNV
jgi:hypothetical protein